MQAKRHELKLVIERLIRKGQSSVEFYDKDGNRVGDDDLLAYSMIRKYSDRDIMNVAQAIMDRLEKIPLLPWQKYEIK